MLFNGEKYACEACVRGHRVSNCNHTDRPLTHINKKGRPVSQCPHCRGLRKARSSHVKCECGDKPHGKVDPIRERYHSPMRSERSPQRCTCRQGSRCICALKKDRLDLFANGPKPSITRSRSNTDGRKPLMSGLHSETSMTMFANGHHKPVHRSNHMGQECGLPYKIPRPHSIHGGQSSFRNSTDSLPLLSGVDAHPSYMLDSIAQQEERLVRSEHGSPGLRPKIDPLNQLPQLDFSYTPLNTDLTASPVPEDYSQNSYAAHFESYFPEDQSQPTSAALSMPAVDWSAFDLPLDGGNFSAQYSQAPSYASFDHAPTSHPGLTSSSSADVSENEDIMNTVQSPSVQGAASPYPMREEHAVMGPYSLSTESFHRMTPPPMLPPSVTSVSMDSYMPTSIGSPRDYEEYSAAPKVDAEAFAHHGFTIQDAQKLAHPGLKADVLRELSPSHNIRPTSDPLWHASFDDASFNPSRTLPEPLWTN